MAIDQNYTISQMPQVSAATAAHSGPYTIKEGMQGALVVISGLTSETVAVLTSPDSVTYGATAVTGQTALGNGTHIVDLRGATQYKFVKSGASDTAVVTHSVFRYS